MNVQTIRSRYLKDSKTLIFAIPLENLNNMLRSRDLIFLELKAILTLENIKLKDVKLIGLCTPESLDVITEKEKEQEQLWNEFIDWKQNRESNKINKVLDFSKH